MKISIIDSLAVPQHDPVVIDPGVNDVTITEAFLGVGFVTVCGETIGVSMRDSGFEILYRTAGVDGPVQHWSLNGGVVKQLS